jgi:hypothetical protein
MSIPKNLSPYESDEISDFELQDLFRKHELRLA